MSYHVRRLINHLPLGFLIRSDWHLLPVDGKRVRFANFLSYTGFRLRRFTFSLRGRSSRRRQLRKNLILITGACAIAWIAVESARAISLF